MIRKIILLIGCLFLSTDLYAFNIVGTWKLVAIEANMPEAYQLNDYVLYGQGDLKKLIKIHFWLYQTNEFLFFIEWLRNYNKTVKNKVQLVGFDMQTPYSSLQILRNFITKLNDSELMKKITSIEYKIMALDKSFNNNEKISVRNVKPLKNEVNSLKISLLAKKSVLINDYGLGSFNWTLQNITLIYQYLNYLLDSYNIRDQAMAKNIQWILNQNSHSKIIIWAHNGHLQKTKAADSFFTPMGQYLYQEFNTKYRVIGFTASQGNYLSMDIKDFKMSDKFQLINQSNSLEDLLDKLHYNIIFLDLLKIRDKHESTLLLKPIYWHLDAMTPNQFSLQNISKAFDGIIFIKKTSPAHISQLNIH